MAKRFKLGAKYRPKKQYRDKMGNVILNMQLVEILKEGFIVLGVDINGGVDKLLSLENGHIVSRDNAFLVQYDRYMFKRIK